MSDLIQALEYRIKGCAKRNRRNYYAAFSLLIMAVAASAATAIAVAVDEMPKSLIAALASVSGIFVLINSTFRFEERSRWYWRKRTRLEIILRQHKFEWLSESEASRKWNEIDEEMFSEWPGFGSGPFSATAERTGKG
ncbi:hypothetical protein [[Pseudomonas] boreopolis]|uniref:hypothetical protein n=1 Tax=Xanthomonas boreopolis TaxID=86183 RepID=UPI003DA13FC6